MSYLLALHAFSDWGLLALRIAVAATFWAHGTSKFGSWKQPSGGMNGMMRLLSICEPLGAAAVLTGFLTQPAALGLALVMCGAMYLKITKWKVPYMDLSKNGWELDFLLLASNILLLLGGAGAFSLDRLLLSL